MCIRDSILVVAVIIVILLLRRRRQREKEAAAAAQQTVVGPSTKPIQPTHNGTWSGTFSGLWKAQTWREMPEDDELPLSDRANGTRSVLVLPQVFSSGYYSSDWPRFLTETDF